MAKRGERFNRRASCQRLGGSSCCTLLSQGTGGDSSYGSTKSTANSTTEQQKQESKNHPEPVHWHNRGVAARALHLSRGVEKPSGRVTYIVVVLEALCRFSV